MKNKKGFTLIEIMVSISIIAILATIGMVTFSQSQIRGRDAKRKQDLRSIATALELFYQTNKRYPCSGTGTTWATSSQAGWLSDSNAGTCGGTNTSIAPTYISMVPKDPSSDSATAYLPGQMGYAYLSTDAATWGTCSKNQYYLLVTHLENPNDSDRLELKPVTICGTDITTATYGNNAFVIAQ